MPLDSKQRGLMVGALCLLLLALAIVLWHDRDFWFPDSQQADAGEVESPAAITSKPIEPAAAGGKEAAPPAKVSHRRVRSRRSIRTKASTAEANLVAAADQPAAAFITRTVLPPLEVEVIAGDTHRTLRPGSNSVHVELQPGSPSHPAADPIPTGVSGTAANLTSDAAERVQMSVDTSQVVARPVRPSYPLLARQMKVQGSVILDALVGKDGVIQNLSVVSGPPILATAAQEAVRQWHFKPHFEGNEAVETEAKITVNFTISTN
ncbi:MAG TPA: energy transducer TonB [Candidatus Aquilonibacter sp.]|nr:energy transducer TonB [Candidatus Aquilonibacter sp.]